MDADQIIQKHFPKSASELVVGEFPVSELAERYGTPFYVYDAELLRARYEEVKQALGDRVSILFAMKANPSAGVVNVLTECGAGLDVTSRGEIYVAGAVGVKGKKIHFAGPGKSREDIDAALESGIGAINVESRAELELISQAARERQIVSTVSLRIHPDQALSGSRMRMGGGTEKFGIPVEEAEELMHKISKDPFLELKGLHIYAGTQCFDAAAWVANCRYILDVATKLEQATGQEIYSINFGGGFGVPYFAGEKPFDLAAAGEGIREVIAEDNREDREYFVELGRYLTAPAGVFVSQVQYAKQIKETNHLILDGGMNHYAAAAGLGSVIKRPYPMVAATNLEAEERQAYAVGGNLCTPADEFCAQQMLPPTKAGDLVAILMSGAYGLSFSPTLFLSHPTPCELMVDGNEAFIIRDRGIPSDAMRGQWIPRRDTEFAEVA